MSITFDDPEIRPNEGDPSGGWSRVGTRRAMAVVGAAALVVGALGIGYAVGRSGDVESTATESPALPSSPASIVERSEETTASTVRNDDTDPPRDAVVDAEDAAASFDTGFGGDAPVSSGGAGYPAFGTSPMDLLAERATPDGFVLRAHLGETWVQEPGGWGAGDWQPAPWCFESGQIRVALAGNGVVDVGSVPWYREPYNGRSVTWLPLGGVDGNPRLVLVVQAPPDSTSVTVSVDGGATDSAVPQNGIALLTVAGVPAEPVVESGYTSWNVPAPTFTVTFEGGATPGTVGSDGIGGWNDVAFREACQPPPPALPEPGVQPADPAAAEAQIVTAMTVLYDATEVGERDVYVDDPSGVGEARAEVAAGGSADQAASAQAIVEELVFTAPAEAWFRYRIETANGVFDQRYGVAVDVEGQWKITRDTVCQDISLAGGDCGGGWSPVHPPSMRGMFEPEVD